MQRTNQVAAHVFGRVVEVAPTLEHHRLAMATHVGQQLNALSGANQRATFLLMGQGVVIADVGHRQGMADVAGPGLEKLFDFLRV